MMDATQIFAIDGTREAGRDPEDRNWRPMPRISEESYTANYFQAESVWVQVLGDIRNLGRASAPCSDFVPLRGTWGERRAPVRRCNNPTLNGPVGCGWVRYPAWKSGYPQPLTSTDNCSVRAECGR